MTQVLIKKFIKNAENTSDPAVREAYGKLSGIVGIIANLILSAMKILAGLIFGSISILADGINNLSDASASLITFIGFKLASKSPDSDHPYGHGRTEYLTGLIICAMIIAIGVKLFISSFEKTLHPESVEFSWLSVVILVLAIGVKFWLAGFNNKLGDAISSDTIRATAADSKNDVISTAAVLLALLVFKFTSFNLDGPVGILVAVFILKSGLELTKDTLAPILGQMPEPELTDKLEKFVCSHDGILGIHDMIVHDYGPGRRFASLHAEVDARGDVLKIHDMIDNIEKEVYEDFHILLTIHMDPLDVLDPLTKTVCAQLAEIVKDSPDIKSFHDVRVVKGESHHNIVCDIVLAFDSPMEPVEAKQYLTDKLKEYDPLYRCVITVDREYVSH